MGDICRLCLLKITSPDLPVYKNDVPDETKIRTIIPEIDLQMTTTIALCNLCSRLLNAAYEFRRGCLKTEENLKEYINKCGVSTPIDLESYSNFKSEDCKEIKAEIIEEDEEDVDNVDNTQEDFNVNITYDKCGSVNVFIADDSYDSQKEVCDLYKCDECGEGFPLEVDMQSHFTEHMLKKPHRCKHCNKLFTMFEDLRVHILNTHSTFSPLICDICNKPYANKHSLHLHKITHSNEDHSCPICYKKITRKDQLKLHIESHNVISVACEICGKSLTGEKALKSHILNQHRRPNKCETCGMICCSKNALVEHVRIHTGEKPHCCEICGKGFTQKSTLDTHRKLVHSTETPFVCDLCGKAFSVKNILTKHLKKHQYTNKERNVSCLFENCEKKFTSEKLRNAHMHRHRGRNIICQVCGMAFFDNGGLRRHMLTHTGEKPYACDICHKTFNQRGNLKIHLKSHRPKNKRVKASTEEDKEEVS